MLQIPTPSAYSLCINGKRDNLKSEAKLTKITYDEYKQTNKTVKTQTKPTSSEGWAGLRETSSSMLIELLITWKSIWCSVWIELNSDSLWVMMLFRRRKVCVSWGMNFNWGYWSLEKSKGHASKLYTPSFKFDTAQDMWVIDVHVHAD